MRVKARCKREGCRRSDPTGNAKACPACGGPISYTVRYSVGAGRMRSQTFADRDAAEAALGTRIVKRARGTYREGRDPRKVRLEDYVAGWLDGVERDSRKAWSRGERGVLGRRTVEKYRRTFRLYIAPALGRRTLATLTRADAIDLRDRTKVRVSDYQANEALALLRRILNRAVDEELLDRNVASRVKLLTPKRQRPVRIVTGEEVEAIAAAIEPRYRAFVLLLHRAALRFAEAVGIREEDLELERGRLTIRRTLNESRADSTAGQLYIGPTKDGRDRDVVLDDELADELLVHLEEYPPLESEDPRYDGLVFSGPRGGAIRSRVFGKAYREAALAAGIRDAVAPMYLRHSGITEVLRATGSTKAAAEWAGHADTRMAEGHYVAYTRDDALVTSEALVAYRGRTRKSRRLEVVR